MRFGRGVRVFQRCFRVFAFRAPGLPAVCQNTASGECVTCVQPRADTAIKLWVDCLAPRCGATAAADDGQSPGRAAANLADLVTLAALSAPAAVSLSVGQPCSFTNYSTCKDVAYGLYALNCAGTAKTGNEADDPLATYQRALTECSKNSCNATAVSGCLALVCNGTCQINCPTGLCCSPSTGSCVARRPLPERLLHRGRRRLPDESDCPGLQPGPMYLHPARSYARTSCG